MKMTGTFCRTAVAAALNMSLMLGGAAVTVAGGLTSATAQDRGPVQRVVHGKVTDKGGSGIKGAVVYLQDEHTQAVKSAISDDDGTYRFVQLSQSTDYTLYAKNAGKKSKNKTISSFDSKNDFDITLTID